MSRAREIADLGSPAASGLSDRNLIINGAVQVAQRRISATASSGYNTVDRFQLSVVNMDNAAYTYVQSSVAPTGFSKSWRIDCTTVESALAADEYSTFTQAIEAQNLQQISNGSSAAKSLTLSFYVKSNKTGVWGLNLYKPDNTGRQITATYTISSADTWEFKTITFAGDTAGGGINDDTGAGLYVYWGLAAGSDYTTSDSTSWSNYSNAGFLYGHNVNFFDNTANDWAVTGVQLEIGEVATAFEVEDFGTTLAKCQRYYQKSYDYSVAPGTATQVGATYSTTEASANYPTAGFTSFPVKMRATPTITSYDYAGNSGKIRGGSDNVAVYIQAPGESGFGNYVNNVTVGANSGVAIHYEAAAEL